MIFYGTGGPRFESRRRCAGFIGLRRQWIIEYPDIRFSGIRLTSAWAAVANERVLSRSPNRLIPERFDQSMCKEDPHPALTLATRVIEARDSAPWFKMAGSSGLIVTDDSVRRLIRLVYDASLLEEEGRFPTVRLVCANWPPHVRFGNNPPWDSPTIHDPEQLRRIAPTATRPGSALAISTAVEPRDVRCIGLYDFAEIIDPTGRTSLSNVWEKDEVLSGPLLVVRIEGPGRIRAGFLPAQSFLLRGGVTLARRSWVDIPAVSRLFEEASKSLQTRLKQIEHQLISKVLANPRQVEHLLLKIWGHLLGLTTAARHGGAFIITFEDDLGDGVRDGYHASLDFGEILTTAVSESLLDAGNNFQAFRRAWEGRRLMLFNAAAQIAGLSAVDGCVLMDRQLKLTRFGGRLHSKASHEIPEGLSGTGTRHSSAFQFCTEHKSVAFVVSQDRQLTVIVSRIGEKLEVFRDVDPSVEWSSL
jgi:hypothetical protein